MGPSDSWAPFTVTEEELEADCLRFELGLRVTTVGDAPETSNSKGSMRTEEAPSPSVWGFKWLRFGSP